MSTSGRYQSRLFSFFSQQSLRLKDKTGQAWRQVKLAAVWSTQIALYPIYALFQAGRLLGRQMGQATRQVFPRLRAAKQQILNPSELNPSELNPSEPFALLSDTPIHNLLAESLKERLGESLGESQGESLAVRGFASSLLNRGLVLVTIENEALDILTRVQQTQLQRQMIWEMANYWRYRKTQPLEDRTHLQGWTNTFLPLPKERANLLPPIRAFRHWMAWMQLSPVAIAVNLFQESRLIALPSAADPSPEDLPLRSAQLPGSRVDQLVHNLFNDRSPKPVPLIAWVKRQANGLAEFSKSLGGLLQNSSIVLYDPLPRSEPEDFSLVSPTLPQTSAQTPWLKIEDFLGGEFLGVTGSGQIVKRGEAAVQRTGAREENPGEYLETIAPFDHANELTMRSPSTSALSQPARNEGAIASTLLEAEVTGVSYEKHPLEQLLKWLDLGMLWIEQKLGQVWNWLHRS
jgi:hypothetical protein